MKEVIRLDRVSRATGLKLDHSTVELTLRLQNEEQRDQYIDALNIATLIYEDAQQHGGETTQTAQEEWSRANKLIGFWASMADAATPKRRSWFGRRAISPGAKLMLLRTLSPEADIMKSGELG